MIDDNLRKQYCGDSEDSKLANRKTRMADFYEKERTL